jgi:hypothetical protein
MMQRFLLFALLLIITFCHKILSLFEKWFHLPEAAFKSTKRECVRKHIAQIVMESPEFLKLIFPDAAERPEEAPAGALEK